mmetsp:Transcript_22505/g.55703  ORF Transcript_22505/g.55703 Transcript_22505/m.55703 type:complete len:233 (-) Transcript_22505:366-1064(-)
MWATMMRAVCREMLTTLAPRKYPLGTVVGRVSLGTSVVWYQPISFTWYAPTVGSLVLRNRPLLDRRNTFSPGEKGRTTASMAPPIKLEMRSFAARPNVKPPMPPKPIRLDVGNPKRSAVSAIAAEVTANVARRVMINLWLVSLMPNFRFNIPGSQWLVDMTAMIPLAIAYIPRSKSPIISISVGRKLGSSRAVPSLKPLSKRYVVIHSAPTTRMGFAIHRQNDFSHSTPLEL